MHDPDGIAGTVPHPGVIIIGAHSTDPKLNVSLPRLAGGRSGQEDGKRTLPARLPDPV